jgi:hypothetical protein
VIDGSFQRLAAGSVTCVQGDHFQLHHSHFVTTTHKTTTNAAPSLRAHVTKKDKTVVEGKAAFSSKARVPGLRAAVEAEGKEPSEGREAHNQVRVRN